ncbi:MAG TPA: formate dehydrogenase [Gammaproteobacteria bacterium]|jgi:formate dehydrogenase subunit gamma|nr:formate dehydrogenase [Gammaproteobacteria bacterium]
MNDTDQMICVREKKTIRLHWFNALCWLLLLASGFGIISGDFVRLAPTFWPELMQGLFGGNDNLVLAHIIVGISWVAVFVFFILFNFKGVVFPFLKNVLVLTPMAAFKDTWSMVVTLAHLFGLMKNTPVPPQGRYNGAQRLLGTMIIFCSLFIIVSGLYLFFGPQLLSFSENSFYGIIFRWALVGHAASVFLVIIGLIAHIYFALIEERESLEAMKSGNVSVEFIKHHNALWYEELKQEGKV